MIKHSVQRLQTAVKPGGCSLTFEVAGLKCISKHVRAFSVQENERPYTCEGIAPGIDPLVIIMTVRMSDTI